MLTKVTLERMKSFKASLASDDINYDADTVGMEIPSHFRTDKSMSDENVPKTITDMVLALHLNNPVLTFISAHMVGMSSNHKVAIMIWGIKNGRYVCTNTFGTQTMTFDPHNFNREIKNVWIL